jgi:hypothetical protein
MDESLPDDVHLHPPVTADGHRPTGRAGGPSSRPGARRTEPERERLALHRAFEKQDTRSATCPITPAHQPHVMHMYDSGRFVYVPCGGAA